jgi:hypothetical protein
MERRGRDGVELVCEGSSGFRDHPGAKIGRLKESDLLWLGDGSARYQLLFRLLHWPLGY